MATYSTLGVIGFAVAASVFALLFRSNDKSKLGGRPLPGPGGMPFVGNLLQLPPYHTWFKFFEWSKVFGPIYQISLAGRTHVVVSTEKIANDLLRDRGAYYSSREQLPMATTLYSGGLRLALMPNDDLWRRERKLYANFFHPNTTTNTIQPVQLLETAKLMDSLLQTPTRYEILLNMYSANVIMRLTYAKSFQTGDEAELKRVIHIGHELERVMSPGAYLVDTFPVLLWLPSWLAPFKREAASLQADMLGLFRDFLSEATKEEDNKNASPSFSKTWHATKDQYDLTNDQAACTMGQLFEAGSVTTAAAMMNHIFALVHHPEWHSRIQAEMDATVPESRLPDFSDIPRLPTLRATVKESLRWRPVAAGGLPHQSTKDGVYDGYFITKGTNIHPNQWAIHREPSLYPDPETYNPERWLDSPFPTYKEPLSVYPNLSNFSAFGFGRRICPGLAMAEGSLYIFAARLAWACTVKKQKRKDGTEIDIPLYDYTTGFSVQPKFFPFELKPRSNERRQLVQDDWEREKSRDPLKS